MTDAAADAEKRKRLSFQPASAEVGWFGRFGSKKCGNADDDARTHKALNPDFLSGPTFLPKYISS